MSSNESTSTEATDSAVDWATLAQPSTATLMGPAGLVRAIVQSTNARLVKPYEAALRAIDEQHQRADATAKQLRQHVHAALTPVRAWLRERADTECLLDKDPSPTYGCTLNPNESLQARFSNAFAQIDVPSAVEAWKSYQSPPRTSRYSQLNEYAGAGGVTAGVAFLLLLLANAFTDGVGFFKTIYFIGVVGGLGAVVINLIAKADHRKSIEAAFAGAQRATADASTKLEEVARQLDTELENDRATIHKRLTEQEDSLRLRYGREVQEANMAFEQARTAAGLFGQSAKGAWATGEPVAKTVSFVRIGELLAPNLELDWRFQPPITLPSLPALAPFAPGRGLCLTGSNETKALRIAATQSIALRLIAGVPPGKLRFTFIDPVGLGHNVAPLLSLGDQVEELIGGRAWSEPVHIEQRLAELTQHMETVIQKYLRNEHKTIESYNASAGQVVEAYRILVVCDFPVNFTETAARRLTSIAQNGPRCGVYPFIIVDSARAMPYGVSLDPLAAHLTFIGDRTVPPVATPAKAPAATAEKTSNSKPELGASYCGHVQRITDFGAFIEIIPGYDGLLHVSEIAHHRVKDVRDELKEGQEITVKVINIDPSGKIWLSRKALLKEGGGTAPRSSDPENEPEEVTKARDSKEAGGLGQSNAPGRRNGASVWSETDFESWSLVLDDTPSGEMFQHVTKAHGELAEMGMRVSVPFGDLVAHAGLNVSTWRDHGLDSSADGLMVPLGQSGVRKYQELLFGKGTAHHALVVGQTGSGKSNLLHALITMLALKYAPDELDLYLVDFKQGVEFKLYAEAALPHARVIAIQSEREFGLSVLRGLLAEMDRRGDLFRTTGVPSLADWRRRSGQKLPRILLLVDEFRVFFTVDDTIATEATMIIDRLVSQGRAFGMHVVLASQTLAGTYALPRSITDQMAVRVVLQCTEADSRLALADDNPEARLLSRPGEAIYNDQRGLIEGNHHFQVADMGDDEMRASIVREHLVPRVAAWPNELRRPVVFEGHRPARVEESVSVAAAIDGGNWLVSPPRFVDIWLGEPISLRPATSVRFLRQGGANLLMVMRDEAQAVTLMQVAMVTIAAQLSPMGVGFHVVDMSSADASWAGSFERLGAVLPHRKNVVGRRGLGQTLESVSQELERRLKSETPTAESIFMLFVGLHRMHDLRENDGAGWSGDESRADVRRTFAKILREGPELGIYSLIWADSQSSTARVFDRRMLGDCGRRVVGSMSEQDSLALIDEPLAGHLDKPHRLIRFDEDRPGDLETFRPYAVSEPNWLIEAAQRLSRRSVR